MVIKDFYYLFVIALIKMVSWSSSNRLRESVVNILAFTAYRFSKTKRRHIERNISIAFDENLNIDLQQPMVKATFRRFWQHVFSWLPSSQDRASVKRAGFRGIEFLQKALDNEKGVILWESNGFGQRILAKRILAENGFSIHQVHGPNDLGGFFTDDSYATWMRRSLVRPFFEKCEMKFVKKIIYLPSSNSLAFTRSLLKLLDKNAIVCISGDGKVGQKLIPLKFLGQTEFFPTGMVSLSKISGARILPFFCIEEKSGKSCLIIEHPINVETDSDRDRRLGSTVSQYAGLLEVYIKSYPEQYQNWHLVGQLPAGGVAE